MSAAYLVVGAPSSGKSTYCRKHANGRTAVVLDLDAIKVALGSPVTHGHSDRLIRLAMAARDGVIAQWRKETNPPALYIICCTPDQDLYRMLPAKFTEVKLSTPEALCHERADAANRPPGTHKLISDWFKANAKGSQTA